jgi:hypothetical protein
MLCLTNATYPAQRPRISGVEHTINAVNEVLIVDKVHSLKSCKPKAASFKQNTYLTDISATGDRLQLVADSLQLLINALPFPWLPRMP